MTVNSMTETGLGSPGITHAIMTSLDAQNRFIENALANMKAKGYVGLNMGFYSILEEDIPLYVDFIANTTKRLNSQGYEVFVTLTPYTLGYQASMNYNKTYYADLGGAANKVILLTYLWQYGTINEVYQTTVAFYKENLEFVVTQIDPEKIFIGLTRIAYDWEIPYVEDKTGHFLTNASAITLANQLGVEIEFDEVTQTPYYYYNASGLDHYVWFKDSRSINAILNLVDQYGLAGVAVWTINFYHPQTWLCINSS
jgi:spore germination protein